MQPGACCPGQSEDARTSPGLADHTDTSAVHKHVMEEEVGKTGKLSVAGTRERGRTEALMVVTGEREGRHTVIAQ